MTSFKAPSRTFCILPWLHLATLTDGSATLCCVAKNESGLNLNNEGPERIWNSEYWKRSRRAMLNGDELDACQRCYDEEKHGYQSHRLVENLEWSQRLGAEALQKRVSSTQSDGRLKDGFVSIDLRLGNACNLQCVMCQPKESSKWLANARKLSAILKDRDLINEWKWKSEIEVEKYEWYRNPAFWEGLRGFLPYITEIIVGGGEPMLIQEQAEFIKYCAESGEAGHIHLRYHTNATILCEELLPHWTKFKVVELLLSIDGTSEINEYVRFPANWTKIESNMRIYDDLPDNVQLMVLSSVHALNMFYIPEFVRYLHVSDFKKAKFGAGFKRFFHPGIVQWPNYLSPTVLPPELKKEITEKVACLQSELDIHFDKLEAVVRLMNSRDDRHLLPMLRDYCRGLDKVRGTSFETTFREIKKGLFGDLGSELHA